jgi:hypothetical protein
MSQSSVPSVPVKIPVITSNDVNASHSYEKYSQALPSASVKPWQIAWQPSALLRPMWVETGPENHQPGANHSAEFVAMPITGAFPQPSKFPPKSTLGMMQLVEPSGHLAGPDAA